MKKPEIVIPDILKIEPYKPGTSEVKGIENPVKLSSNENPFGASPKAFAALEKAIKKVNRYPDGSCAALRGAIAKQYDIAMENIVCGAGSDELIALLCQAYAADGDEVIYSEHGFLMYPISALRVGAVPVIARESTLRTDVKNILEQVTDKTRIVFIANPNNPTGSYITRDEMRDLRGELPSEILLVIDSAYGEYVDAEDYSTGIGMAEETENTVMLRTFSKIYGLSSLRLGWAYCPPAIADILNRVRGPFNVSDIAQAAGVAAILDVEYTAMVKNHNSKWREKLSEELSEMGLKVFPSVANFLLVEFPAEKPASAANDFLKSKGIIAREMGSYKLDNCMRFTIGLAEENTALLAALKEFMG